MASRIGRGLEHIGATGVQRTKRGFGNVSGNVSGNRAYKSMYANAQTAYGRDFIDAHIEKDKLRTMHKVLRHLEHHEVGRIDAVVRRYGDDPRLLEKHISSLKASFVRDLLNFKEAFSLFIIRINDQIVKTNNEFASNYKALLAMLQRYHGQVSEHKLAVPRSIVEATRKSLEGLAAKDAKQKRRIVRLDERIESGGDGRKMPHVARVSMHKVQKLFKKTEHEEIHTLRENMRMMIQKLDEQKAGPEFLIYYRHHVENLEKVSQLHQLICLDLLKLLGQAESYYAQVVAGAADFIAIFNSAAKGQQDLQSTLDEVKKEQVKVKKILEANTQTQRTLHWHFVRLEKAARRILDELVKISDANIARVRSDVAAAA